MGLTILFTHLKIILLQCILFSVLVTISSIQTDKERKTRKRDRNDPFQTGIKTGGTNKIKAKKKKQLEYETNVGLVGAVYCKYGLDKKIKLYQLVQLLLKQNFY